VSERLVVLRYGAKILPKCKWEKHGKVISLSDQTRRKIQEVLISNLILGMGYWDRVFVVFLSPYRNMPG
jgi:hypothetical protein